MLAAPIMSTTLQGEVIRVGYLAIQNDGTGNALFGNYNVEYLNEQLHCRYSARVENYPRSDGALLLIIKSIWAIKTAHPNADLV